MSKGISGRSCSGQVALPPLEFAPTPQDRAHIVARFRDRRDPTRAMNPARTRIVGRERKRGLSKSRDLHAQIACGAGDIGGQVVAIDPEIARGAGHQLPETKSTDRAAREGIVTAFLQDEGVEKTDRNALLAGSSADERVEQGSPRLRAPAQAVRWTVGWPVTDCPCEYARGFAAEKPVGNWIRSKLAIVREAPGRTLAGSGGRPFAQAGPFPVRSLLGTGYPARSRLVACLVRQRRIRLRWCGPETGDDRMPRRREWHWRPFGKGQEDRTPGRWPVARRSRHDP